MPKPAFSAETFRVPALIAAVAGLIVVAGVALVKADEHMGTAHVASEQAAPQPEDDNSAGYTAPPAFEATQSAKSEAKPEAKPAPALGRPPHRPPHRPPSSSSAR